MRETKITIPELVLVAGTRALGGAGVGLLLANRLSDDQRRAVGWTLFLVGALSTIPLAFDYFVHEANLVNGLVADKTQEGAPASIAAIGLALAAYPVGVERAFMTRAEAVERTLAALRFFRNSSQGTQAEATGYKGFY